MRHLDGQGDGHRELHPDEVYPNQSTRNRWQVWRQFKYCFAILAISTSVLDTLNTPHSQNRTTQKPELPQDAGCDCGKFSCPLLFKKKWEKRTSKEMGTEKREF